MIPARALPARAASRCVVPIVAPPGELSRARAWAIALAASCARHGHADADIVVVPAGAPLPREATRAIVIEDPTDLGATREALAAVAGLRVRRVRLAPPPPIDRIAREVLGLTVGVALGAGGARGFAHVGVLETLAAHGIPIDCIAGTSVGSVIGALWAYGHPPDEIMAMCGETRRHYLKWTLPLRSLLSNRGIAAHIERSAAGRTFEDAPIALGAVAADLRTGERVLLRAGKLAPAILASSSIPGVFPAVAHGARRLVDGGICEPVPAHSCRELGADLVVAVNLGAGELADRTAFGVVGAVLRANAILQARAHAHTAALADVVIAPALRASTVDFARADELRRAGRAAAEAALPALRGLMPWTVAA